ncbi:MAG: hypothetical protein P8P30_00360 [Rickettsiales bacterium]|nr:hypothetical protein [Rickettsiales bacterium]
MQLLFWIETRPHKPTMEIVPAVPGELAVKALAFGDNEVFFRLLALHLQNFGDTFGRFTALREYNFERLSAWFDLMDTLNDKSDYIPTLASYYFSQTQNKPDVIHVVNYLRKHSQNRLNEKWWWQAQAVYLANHKLKNDDLALELAKPLLYAENVPLWVNQLPAFIYEKRGEFGDALAIMEHIKANAKDIKPGELRFIKHFIDERLGALERSQAIEEVTP